MTIVVLSDVANRSRTFLVLRATYSRASDVTPLRSGVTYGEDLKTLGEFTVEAGQSNPFVLRSLHPSARPRCTDDEQTLIDGQRRGQGRVQRLTPSSARSRPGKRCDWSSTWH
jgi:hypothetical protein